MEHLFELANQTTQKRIPPIMKKISQATILLLLSYNLASACECPIITFTERFTRSDFVAEIRITKNFDNEGEEELYKSDIQILNLYKGDSINSIYVAGRSDGEMGSSCSIYIRENTVLFAYANKNRGGKFTIGMCSGLTYTKNHRYIYDRGIQRERAMLSILKNKNIVFTDKIRYGPRSTLHSDLGQFDGIKLNKNFALFEITFASDLTIKSVTKISGFRRRLDRNLVEMLDKSKWGSSDNGIRDSIPDNSKLLIGIYYYPKEVENPSFLSLFDL